jgi:hypothetical protein
MNYLQMSPGSSSFFLIFAVKQIHTLNKSLFLHKALPVKSTPHSPPLLHQENTTAKNATEKYQFSN